jgi:hypothetical protein
MQTTTKPQTLIDPASTVGLAFPPSPNLRPTPIEKRAAPSDSQEETRARVRSFHKFSQQIFQDRPFREYFMDVAIAGAVIVAGAIPLGYVLHQLTSMMIRYR